MVNRPRIPSGREKHRQHAMDLMSAHPLIDTHVDLPLIMRAINRDPVEAAGQLSGSYPGHVDVPRMREGKLGGIFMAVWLPCRPGTDYCLPNDVSSDILNLHHRLRSLTSLDDFQYARTSEDTLNAFKVGRFATFIGVEGAHMLGNSLSILRVWAQLGVRYITLTHTGHNAFASSAGSGGPIEPVHPGNGLTELGRELIKEMNRTGIMIDLSHVSDETMRQAIQLSKAPVLFSHSNARALCDHPRNIPDDVLDMIGSEEGKNSGVIHCVFNDTFVSLEDPTLAKVADHIEYIAERCGKGHVGIGSDFDGIDVSVTGLEDATKYPDLIAEMVARGWTDGEIVGLMGGNLMRVMDEVDRIQYELRDQKPSGAVYDKRTDIPGIWLENLPDLARKHWEERERNRQST
uniref:Dipeptidase n=1 Tax=Kwoniella bestiolae CBS 10118 TaxID=1296100 RepID=A0A1B9FZY7_9TREE|nr:hypothetical protein I302_05790 [Kwoniella bestiolae CBS 10118]OCF24331.1 hypothetical protein I302_05790 [Kwoniella bestiolae CBS 10118]